MNRYIASGLVVMALVGTFLPIEDAEARRKVVCTFDWADNPSMNVKGSHGRYTAKEVRNKEYDRLVSMGKVRVRVSAEKGNLCQLNHPENATLDLTVVKQHYLLDPQRRIPNCADFQATVRCVGSN